MILNIRHTGIVVRNLEQAVEFYELLGFKMWKREIEQGQFLETVVNLKNARVETAKLKAPCGAMLELLEYQSHPDRLIIKKQSSNKLGCSHIALTVDSIHKVLESINNNGGSIVNQPAISPGQKVLVAYCHDHEGNLLELVEEL